MSAWEYVKWSKHVYASSFIVLLSYFASVYGMLLIENHFTQMLKLGCG